MALHLHKMIERIQFQQVCQALSDELDIIQRSSRNGQYLVSIDAISIVIQRFPGIENGFVVVVDGQRQLCELRICCGSVSHRPLRPSERFFRVDELRKRPVVYTGLKIRICAVRIELEKPIRGDQSFGVFAPSVVEFGNAQ